MFLLLLMLAAALAAPFVVVKLAAAAPGLDLPSGLVSWCESYCQSVRRRLGGLGEIRTAWYLLAAGVALALFGAPPPVAALLIIASVVLLFGELWLREFRFLITLRDDAFPGHNDKLIWGILLIVMPPLGVWLFHGYREAHWPEMKPSSSVDRELA